MFNLLFLLQRRYFSEGKEILFAYRYKKNYYSGNKFEQCQNSDRMINHNDLNLIKETILCLLTLYLREKASGGVGLAFCLNSFITPVRACSR